jgi:hypothetical protein
MIEKFAWLISYHNLKKSTKITVNLGSAFGHFDNLCLISADKIKIFGRPNTKGT